jgi:hypothetical protein
MPCEVVLLRVDFSKMAAIAMETAKMLTLSDDLFLCQVSKGSAV